MILAYDKPLSNRPQFPFLTGHPKLRQSVLVSLVAIMSYQGLSNVALQSSIRGSMQDGSMERLVHWINNNTSAG